MPPAGAAAGRASSGTERVVLRGPRRPEWSCSCGAAGNWACRVRCLGCGTAAPQRIAQAARAADAAAAAAGSNALPPRARAGKPPPAQPAAANQPTRRSGRLGARAAQAAPRAAKAPVSYADMVKRLLPPTGGAAEAAPDGDATMGPPSTHGTSSDGATATLTAEQMQIRYWRERRAAAQRYGAETDALVCDQEIQALERAALASRPWAVRVQAATDSQKAAADKLRTASENLAEARRAVQHFEAEAAAAQLALLKANAALASVQKETAPARSPPAAAEITEVGIEAAFNTLAAATSVLLQRDGADGGAGGGTAAQLVEHLRAHVTAAVRGAGAAALAGGAAVAAGGRAASVPVVVLASGAGAMAAAAPGTVAVQSALPPEGPAPHAGIAQGSANRGAVRQGPPQEPAARTRRQQTLDHMFRRRRAESVPSSPGRGRADRSRSAERRPAAP